eukprot:1931339-Pyramimonas_sp.AAC.1
MRPNHQKAPSFAPGLTLQAGGDPMPRSGARSTSRSNSTASMMEACWNPNPECAPQAESRYPGKANRPEVA